MSRQLIRKIFFLLLYTIGTSQAAGCAAGKSGCRSESPEAGSIATILRQLRDATAGLKSYQCRIEYLFSQPLFESQTLRKGVLYYQRTGDKSALRINFETLKQDDEEEQKYIEQYLFDGLWLTHINYQMKQVKLYQQAEPNEPVNAFDLARRNFPIIGFAAAEDLEKDFEIELVEPTQGKAEHFVQLHLKVKPGSVYKDDYKSVDFWIDKKLNLPAKIVATSTEEDIYQIRLLEPKINKKIDRKIFECKIPEGFGVERIALGDK